LSDKIINSYFGFVQLEELITKKPHKNLRIGYGGSFLTVQSPEILAQVAGDLDNVEIHYIGNHSKYRPLKNFEGRCILVDTIDHMAFKRYLMDNIDVGFVSLSKDYLGACVPSKIFEYINLGLPILGALPNGDAKDLINNSSYGIACYYKDHASILGAVMRFREKGFYNEIREKVVADRNMWTMETQIKEIIVLLKQMGL
jgi:hypothetical protein